MERWPSGGEKKELWNISCYSTDQVSVGSDCQKYLYTISDSFPNFNQDKNLELVNFAELWREETLQLICF